MPFGFSLTKAMQCGFPHVAESQRTLLQALRALAAPGSTPTSATAPLSAHRSAAGSALMHSSSLLLGWGSSCPHLMEEQAEARRAELPSQVT